MVVAALQHMALVVLGLRGSARALALLRNVLNTILQSGLFCESDGYYDYLRQGREPGHHARVTEDIAGKGLGEAGAVHIAHSIWRRLVPSNPRKQYTKCTREAQQPHFAPHSQHTVGRMLESVRVDTRGMRHTKARVSSSVFLRYKNAEKCRLLLNAVRINASDHRAPKAVRLPTLSHLAHTIKGSKSGRWLCKISLQNCYWSIKLPRSWHRVFVVQARQHCYKYTRLPFGWRYSPSICQTLVKRLVASAISAAKVPVGNKVYLDDVLLDAKSRRSLNIGRRAVVRKLRQAGLVISVKSETRPTKRIGFVGKWFDTLRKYIQNQPAVLAGAFRMWIRAVGTGKISASDLMRLLGRMQWLIRPASLSCVLAGAYRSAYSREDRFTRGLIRSTGTALVFSLGFPSHASPGRHRTAEYILLMLPPLPLYAPGTP